MSRITSEEDKLNICKRCKKPLTIDNAAKNTKRGKICKNCLTKKYKEERDNLPKKEKQKYAKSYHYRNRDKVFEHYGRICACCGEDNIKFLTIDHIEGGGRKHKLLIKKQLYVWLRQNNFPDGFQSLCFNCNCAKGIYGTCPHKDNEGCQC